MYVDTFKEESGFSNLVKWQNQMSALQMKNAAPQGYVNKSNMVTFGF